MAAAVTPPDVAQAFAMVGKLTRRLEVLHARLSDINLDVSTEDADKFVDEIAASAKTIIEARALLAQREAALLPPKDQS
jgi:hypothetical protein